MCKGRVLLKAPSLSQEFGLGVEILDETDFTARNSHAAGGQQLLPKQYSTSRNELVLNNPPGGMLGSAAIFPQSIALGAGDQKIHDQRSMIGKRHHRPLSSDEPGMLCK